MAIEINESVGSKPKTLAEINASFDEANNEHRESPSLPARADVTAAQCQQILDENLKRFKIMMFPN